MQEEMKTVRWDKIESVQRMQDFIKQNYLEPAFPYERLYALAGYSERHANRIFKELTGKTPQEYVRVLRMTKSAEELLEQEKNVLDVALDEMCIRDRERTEQLCMRKNWARKLHPCSLAKDYQNLSTNQSQPSARDVRTGVILPSTPCLLYTSRCV